MPTSPRSAAPPSSDPGLPDVAELSYEQARDELVAVVSRLEAGGESLETALQLWERGEVLAARCQEWLDGARRRLESATAARESATGPGTSGPGTPGPGAPGPGTTDPA